MLLDKLKQWLANDVSDASGASSINLSHGKMIARWLSRYQEQHQFIAVGFEENPIPAQVFSTSILLIDERTQQFYLEELRPATGNRHLKPGVMLYFQLTVDGVKHRFQAPYVKSEDLPEGISHLFAFPSTIEQIQLRNAFRVKIPRSTAVNIQLVGQEGRFLGGEVADISATGARLIIHGEPNPEPVPGEIWNLCRISMPNGSELRCKAQLMHWRHIPHHQHSQLGIMFVELDNAGERILGKFITDLQRQARERSRQAGQ